MKEDACNPQQAYEYSKEFQAVLSANNKMAIRILPSLCNKAEQIIIIMHGFVESGNHCQMHLYLDLHVDEYNVNKWPCCKLHCTICPIQGFVPATPFIFLYRVQH